MPIVSAFAQSEMMSREMAGRKRDSWPSSGFSSYGVEGSINGSGPQERSVGHPTRMLAGAPDR